MRGPGEDVVMTIDPNGPGGLPGALRTAAACGAVVPISAALALRIAREVEDAALRIDALKAMTMDRFRDEIRAEATARAVILVRLFNWSTTGAGLLAGLVIGFALWGWA